MDRMSGFGPDDGGSIPPGSIKIKYQNEFIFR